ncbi:hypothetical protein [Lacticaseibacillus parakribbianus]|uniref:hypothetical protein n=1 Tax=Lacticaseibacillus parakribbianus TaxID=2970927 RepID=UPI0021CB64C7|nr:hypothetical protein [Lacticaseibacillus parakribbianus]
MRDLTVFATQQLPPLVAGQEVALALRKKGAAAAVVADAQPLAVVVTWRSRRHPTLLRFTCACTAAGEKWSPTRIADAVVTAAIQAAKAVRAKGLLLTTAATTPLVAAMVSRGLRRIATIYQPRLSLANVAVPQTALPAGAELLSAAGLAQAQVLQAALRSQAQLTYAAQHPLDPVNPAAVAALAPKLADLVADVPVVLHVNGDLRAFCLVHPVNDTTAKLGLVWAQTPRELTALAEQTLSTLASHFTWLTGAVSDLDPAAVQVARLLRQPLGPEVAKYVLLF